MGGCTGKQSTEPEPQWCEYSQEYVTPGGPTPSSGPVPVDVPVAIPVEPHPMTGASNAPPTVAMASVCNEPLADGAKRYLFLGTGKAYDCGILRAIGTGAARGKTSGSWQNPYTMDHVNVRRSCGAVNPERSL